MPKCFHARDLWLPLTRAKALLSSRADLFCPARPAFAAPPGKYQQTGASHGCFTGADERQSQAEALKRILGERQSFSLKSPTAPFLFLWSNSVKLLIPEWFAFRKLVARTITSYFLGKGSEKLGEHFLIMLAVSHSVPSERSIQSG
jgi:hypothetical protein